MTDFTPSTRRARKAKPPAKQRGAPKAAAVFTIQLPGNVLQGPRGFTEVTPSRESQLERTVADYPGAKEAVT